MENWVLTENQFWFNMLSMLSNKKTLSTAQVAQRLSVDISTIRRWVKRGEFPNAFKLSPVPYSRTVIPESDVIAFEERRDAAMRQ